MARYKDTRTNVYDGVHFYGYSGCQDFTDSVKTILKVALPDNNFVKTKTGFGTAQTGVNHSTCPQTAYQKKAKYYPNIQTSNRFSALNSNSGN